MSGLIEEIVKRGCKN